MKSQLSKKDVQHSPKLTFLPQQRNFDAWHGFPCFGCVADAIVWRNEETYVADCALSLRMRFFLSATRSALPLLAL